MWKHKTRGDGRITPGLVSLIGIAHKRHMKQRVFIVSKKKAPLGEAGPVDALMTTKDDAKPENPAQKLANSRGGLPCPTT